MTPNPAFDDTRQRDDHAAMAELYAEMIDLEQRGIIFWNFALNRWDLVRDLRTLPPEDDDPLPPAA